MLGDVEEGDNDRIKEASKEIDVSHLMPNGVPKQEGGGGSKSKPSEKANPG